MNQHVVTEDRSYAVVSAFLADTIEKLGWAAARVAWVERDEMQLEPWRLSRDAPPELRFLETARVSHLAASISHTKRYTAVTVVDPEELVCASDIAPLLRQAGVDAVLVLDVAGVLDFEARFVFIPQPRRTITDEMCAAVQAALHLIPLVIRQEFERGALSRESMLDPLTGLFNRAGLEALTRQSSDSDSRAIVFVDLDRFKAINDAHGHAVGDEVLSQTGERLAARIRPTDVVGRLGGDEFVMVANNVTDEESAIVVAQRLVSAVARDHLLDNGEVIAVEASAGVVMWQDGREFAEVVRDADELMYEAKRIGGGIAARDGRGRVLVADATPGGQREVIEAERDPIDAAIVRHTASNSTWGAHLVLRGELCGRDATEIAHLMEESLAELGLQFSNATHLLLEPRGRGWAANDRLIDVLRTLPDGPRLIVMVDGQPGSAELRMAALEARARGLVDFALAGVGASASDVRLLASLKPDAVVLDRELTLNLTATAEDGLTLKVVAAMSRVVAAPVVVLDPPASVAREELASWQCDLTTR